MSLFFDTLLDFALVAEEWLLDGGIESSRYVETKADVSLFNVWGPESRTPHILSCGWWSYYRSIKRWL